MARRRPPRALRPDEEALWQRIADSARPLHHAPKPAPKPGPAPPPPPPEPMPPAPAPPEVQPLRPFRIGALHRSTAPPVNLAPTPSQRLGAAPVAMDNRAYRRLTRGKLTPEARLDLHGLTLAEAQPALTRFIVGSRASGRRLVLVITGKGRDRDSAGPIPRRAGALRHEVPLWLSRPPLAPLVLQVAEAHARHGGGGAFYVYLRRAEG